MLLGLDPLQPGHLVLQPVDLLLDGLQLAGMLLVSGRPCFGQVLQLHLMLLVLLNEPRHLGLQPNDDVRIRLRTLRRSCFRQEKS